MNTEYVSMKADQINRHKKVFTRWINLQLANAKPPVAVSDLISELRDGQVLISLLEVLLGIQVTRAEPASKRINQIRNVQEAMRHLLRNNVKTTGIIASEITAGDAKAIISLMWGIIQHFQISEAIQPDPRDYGVDKKLITWCQERLKGNSKNIRISNLTSSWKDGLAFNALLHSFNPALVDLDTMSSSDVKTRLTHAFNMATTTYGVPPLLDPEDVGMDTPDKNMITLFLSYLYQHLAKGKTVKVVKNEITHFPTEMKKEYQFKTITTRHETTRSGSTTYNFKSITTTQEEKNGESVFHDVKTIKEAGQEKVLHVYGFPQNIQIEERRALAVSPFRKLSSSSRTSSSSTSPTQKDSDVKDLEEEALKFPPQISGKGSVEYTVTTKRIATTNAGERVTSTATNKTLQTQTSDGKKDIKTAVENKGKDNAVLTGKGDETDAKATDRIAKPKPPKPAAKPAKEGVTPEKKAKENEKGLDKEQKPTLQTQTSGEKKDIKPADRNKGKDHVLSGKGDEKDAKPTDRTAKPKPAKRAAKPAMERVTPAEKKEKEKEKELDKEQKLVEKKSSNTRDVLLVSTERISSRGTVQKTEPSDPASSQSIYKEDGEPASDVGPPRYFKYETDGSTSTRSTNFVEYLKKKLDVVDQSLFDLEYSSKHSDKDSMDLKSTKNALDHQKEVLLQLESVESKTYDVLEEGKGLVVDKCFDQRQADYFSDRMDATENKMKKLEDNINKEHQRLFDLYMILLKQHLERMNDWLVRAESRMALDDVIELTYELVQLQTSNHQTFQGELSNYSMANMILNLDLEDPAIDDTIRDWVKVLSERWAAVWTWAEEWKEKLKQALLDWNKLREEESALLSWLSSKEQTMDVIGQTDITDEQQVKMHLNLLETLEKDMETQGTRLESLHEVGEQLIKDAEYHNSTAKGIRDQLEDFDRCWEDIVSSVKERKEMLQDAQNKVKQMGNLMKEVRSWLEDTEMFIKILRAENDPQKESKIQEKIEQKCEEREKNQLKVDEINKLEDAIVSNIDKTSNNYMKRVTKPFNKRWNDASIALNRYRNEDYPFIKPDDCFLVKCFKKALVVN